NPRYSLRAFAKALGIGPSALSDMLNGKRTITRTMKERLGLAMGLPLDEIRKYQNAHEAHSKTQLQNERKNILDFQQLTLDTFAIISDWYHYAILELMKVHSFKGDTTWISKSLGITKSEANAAVERLMRVGLIKVSDQGRWVDTSNGFSTN